MSAKTKIVVLHMKHIIVVGALGAFVLLLIILFLSFFGSKKPNETEEVSETMTYVPGVYTSSVKLNDSFVEVQVAVDSDHINSIELVNLDEVIETMYPLISPTLEELSAQILEKQSLEGISYNTNNQYTSLILYNAIAQALEKASPE